MAKMDLSRLSPVSIAVSAAGLALGVYTGLDLLVPAVCAGVAWFALSRLAPADKRPAAPAIAWQCGLLGLFAISAVAAGGAWSPFLPDIAVLAGLLIWFHVSQGRPAAFGLIAYEALTALINAWMFLHAPIESDDAKALATHISWRVVAIVLLILFLRRPESMDGGARPRG